MNNELRNAYVLIHGHKRPHFERGREHERRRMAREAKPCILVRLMGAGLTTPWEPRDARLGDVVVMTQLDTAITSARRYGVDLSALAERMAGKG